MRMMSPKRDQRVLPQATVGPQGYSMNMSMVPMQQQPQYQYQSQGPMPSPQSYMAAQQYAMNPGAGPGLMRVGPRMLPVGGQQQQQQLQQQAVGGMVPGNGVISSAMPQSSATIRIPVGYYSQHPSMMPIPHQMAYSAAAGGVVPIPQQANPNQAAAYYGELMQHPLQVRQTQQLNNINS